MSTPCLTDWRAWQLSKTRLRLYLQTLLHIKSYLVTSWWFETVSTPLKNLSQNGNLPQIGVTIQKYLKPSPRYCLYQSLNCYILKKRRFLTAGRKNSFGEIFRKSKQFTSFFDMEELMLKTEPWGRAVACWLTSSHHHPPSSSTLPCSGIQWKYLIIRKLLKRKNSVVCPMQ